MKHFQKFTFVILLSLLQFNSVIGGNDTAQLPCPVGFTGPKCDQKMDSRDEDPCRPNPCLNGNCVAQRDRKYTCTCALGFTGSKCEQKIEQRDDPCQPNPCINGKCAAQRDGKYTCTCPSGFTGLRCDQRIELPFDPCRPNPCNNGDCIVQRDGQYTCLCHFGFTGPNCGQRVEQRDDPCRQNPCLNGNCIVQRDGKYTCSCFVGFTGPNCNQRVEQPVDPCRQNPCYNGNCIDQRDGKYTCSCFVGFAGSRCEQRIEQPPMPTTTDPRVRGFRFCAVNQCLNGGICIDDGIAISCVCQNGYTGNSCEINGNGCPRTCQNGGKCQQLNIPGITYPIYVCFCPVGYLGDDCSQRAITDGCQNNFCLNGGVCIPPTIVGGQYQCRCAGSWTGPTCGQLSVQNKCTQNQCQNGATCVDGINSNYICRCSAGYYGDYCNSRSSAGPCNSNPCLNFGSCFEKNYGLSLGYECRCVRGYYGSSCESVNQACQINPCRYGSACLPSGSSFQCQCTTGHTGSTCENNSTHDDGGCFPGSSHVMRSDGMPMLLSQLSIGDEILTWDEASGAAQFSPVIAFIDYKPDAQHEFFNIKTSGNTTIRITALHLIAVVRDDEEQQFMYARQVQLGDQLVVYRQGGFLQERVIAINQAVDVGAYAPLTKTGTLVVDGAVASCYAVASNHHSMHLALAPLRWWNSLKHLFLGVPEGAVTEGIHAYAQLLLRLANTFSFQLISV